MKNIMMSDLENYKTHLCTHYEEKGSCPLGKQCKFAHGELELRSRLKNVICIKLLLENPIVLRNLQIRK